MTTIWRSKSDRDVAFNLAEFLATKRSGNGFIVFFELESYLATFRDCLKTETSSRVVLDGLLSAVSVETKKLDFNKLESLFANVNISKSTKEWRFYFGANFKLTDEIQSHTFTVDGCDFCLDSTDKTSGLYTSLLKNPPYQLDFRIRKNRSKKTWPGYLVFSGFGENHYEAYDSVSKKLWAFRGVLELVLNGNTLTHSFPAKTVRAIDLETWVMCQSSEDDIEYIPFNWLVSSYSRHVDLPKVVQIGCQNLLQTQKITSRLESVSKKNLSSILFDCLELLTTASDQLLDENHFLHLWQLAERATMAHMNNGATDVVCRRFAPFLKSPGVSIESAERVMKMLAADRNLWVHSGSWTSKINERLNGEFRLCCCACLWWLWYRCGDISTVNRLDIWYKNLNTRERELKDVIDINSMIINDRQGDF